MKGDKLYHIIISLTKAERKHLLHKCSHSGDKRLRYLNLLLRNISDSADGFQNNLIELAKSYFSSDSAAENDKSLRRFISFATQEIEDLKLQNLLNGNEKTRNYLLTEIFHRENQIKLFDHYVEKAIEFADADLDYYTHSICLDLKMRHKASSQKVKDLILLKDTSLLKNNLLKNLYHQKLSESYNLLSSLYLDNVDVLKDFNNDIPGDKEFDTLIEISKGKSHAVEYKIAQARFHYKNLKKFNDCLLEAINLLAACKDTPHNVDRVSRRLNYLKMGIGFHYGYDLKELIKNSNEVMRVNNLYKLPDSVGFMHHLLFLVLDGRISQAENELKTGKKFYFDKEKDNEFLCQFVQALIYESKGLHSESLYLFKDIAYSSNYYIALWSKLIEFKVHFLKSNIGLCESLLERANRFLIKNKNKPFTYEASRYILSQYKQLLDADPSFDKKNFQNPENIPFSPLHSQILQWIKEQRGIM